MLQWILHVQLRNLGICTRGSGSSHSFLSDDLNIHFVHVTSEPCVPMVANYIDTFPGDENYFPIFPFTEVSLGEVQSSIRHSTSHARSHGGVPQNLILAALPIL